jgi:hypothetical protein
MSSHAGNDWALQMVGLTADVRSAKDPRQIRRRPPGCGRRHAGELVAFAHSRHGWFFNASRRSGASCSASDFRIAIVNEAVTPT